MDAGKEKRREGKEGQIIVRRKRSLKKGRGKQLEGKRREWKARKGERAEGEGGITVGYLMEIPKVQKYDFP